MQYNLCPQVYQLQPAGEHGLKCEFTAHLTPQPSDFYNLALYHRVLFKYARIQYYFLKNKLLIKRVNFLLHKKYEKLM